jgi:hypothetical protein
MKLSTKHTRENNETYLQHMGFALKAASLFALATCAFVIHAVLPWVPVPKRLNLVQMCFLLIDKRH